MNRDPQLPMADRERGAILVVVLVLIFAVALALTAFLYLNNNNTLIASNLAVQSSAQETTDIGLQQVTALLQSAPNWPESLVGTSNAIPGFYLQMPSSGYLSGTTPTANSVIQPPSNPSFWANCVSSNTCAVLPQPVQYGPYSYQVEYVMFPSGGMTTQINGNEQTQTGNGSGALSVRYYVAYVHAARSGGGGLGVTVQAVLEKVMGS
jgi:Tfp pilus assembly protein PilX